MVRQLIRSASVNLLILSYFLKNATHISQVKQVGIKKNETRRWVEEISRG